MSLNVLKTFNKLPQLRTAVLLIVGGQGVGKHRLANAIVECTEPAYIQCRTATKLPLPEEHNEIRPRIDYIVFMVDLTDKDGFSEVKQSLKHVDKHYFLGRVCFIATQARSHAQQWVEVEALTQLTDEYDSPLLWADLNDDSERQDVSKKLLNVLNISAGLMSDVTPLLIDSTRKCYQAETEAEKL